MDIQKGRTRVRTLGTQWRGRIHLVALIIAACHSWHAARMEYHVILVKQQNPRQQRRYGIGCLVACRRLSNASFATTRRITGQNGTRTRNRQYQNTRGRTESGLGRIELDIETLDYITLALNSFQGAVVMVSHNQGFLNGFCKELWVVENGKLDVRYSDTESFDEMFSKYRNDILSTFGSRYQRRKDKATMAKKAKQQRTSAVQNVSLM